MKKNQRIKAHYNIFNQVQFPRPNDSKDWKNHKSLKDYIKFHYSVVQDDVCPYCRERIRYGAYGEPIEHIFPKSEAPEWMFEPMNLCVSCYGCNSKKHDKITSNQDYAAGNPYPLNGESFSIIHPHFDNFSKHISTDGILFKPKNNSNKGRNTIDVCKLNRMDLLFKRAINSSKKKKLLRDFHFKSLCSSYASEEDRKDAEEFIIDLIKRAKYKAKVNAALNQNV